MVKPENFEQFERHAVFLVNPHEGVGHGAKAQGHTAFENVSELALLRRFKDGRKDLPDGRNVHRKGDGFIPVPTDREIALSIAVGAVVHTAAPVCVEFKAVETSSTVGCFEELHRALIYHTPAWLLVTKAFVEPIIHIIVKGIRVGAGHAVRLRPQLLA